MTHFTLPLRAIAVGSLLGLALLSGGCGAGARAIPGLSATTPSWRAAQANSDAAFTVTPQLAASYPDTVTIVAGGNRVITSMAQDLMLWDVPSRLMVRTIRNACGGGDARCEAVGVSDDGRLALVSARYPLGLKDRSVFLWDLATGEELRRFALAEGTRKAWVALSKDGSLAAISSGLLNSVELSVYDSASGKKLWGNAQSKGPLAFSPDGKLLATCSPDAVLGPVVPNSLWQARSGAAGPFFPWQSSWHGVSFSANSRELLTTDINETTLWDLSNQKPLAKFAHGEATSMLVTDKFVLLHAAGGMDDSPVERWDRATGKQVASPLQDAPVGRAAFFPDGARVLTASSAVGGALPIYDLDGGRLDELPSGGERVQSVSFSGDGRRALTAGHAIRVWDLASGSLSSTLLPPAPRDAAGKTKAGGLDWTIAAHFSSDGQRVFSVTSGKLLEIDATSGTLLRSVQVANWAEILGTAATFSIDAARVLVTSKPNQATLWDTTTFTRLRTFSTGASSLGIWSLDLSPDGKAVALKTTDPIALVFDADTGGELGMPVGELDFIGRGHAIALNGRGALDPALVSAFSDLRGAMEARAQALCPDRNSCAAQKLAEVDAMVAHLSSLSSFDASLNGRYALTASMGGTVRLWRIDGGRSVSFSASADDWAAYSDAGFFDASRAGGRLVAVAHGLDVFRIDQLAPAFNRPDLLMEPMGLTPPALSAHWRARYERRLASLGISAGALSTRFDSAPSARISALREAGNRAELDLDLSDEHADLARYNVWVNGVPLFGALGKPVAGRSLRAHESVELTAGRNVIEVGVSNVTGADALRDERRIERKAAGQGDIFYLGFGVSRYHDARLNLAFAGKDALDLASVLRGLEGNGRHVHVKTYTDAEVTVAALRSAKEFFREAKVGDTAVVFVAGHGTHTRDAAAEYLYVTHETDVKHLRETAASFDLIENLLDGITPRQKLLLLDTCESGTRDDESSGPVLAGARGMKSRALNLEISDVSTTPLFISQRDRFIYNDLARRTGAMVISSSRGSEASYEIEGNGVFTKEILQALTSNDADLDTNGVLTKGELFTYLSKAVPARTAERQHPAVDRDNPEMSLALPVHPAAH